MDFNMLTRTCTFFYKIAYPEPTPINQALSDDLCKLASPSNHNEIFQDIRSYQIILDSLYKTKEVIIFFSGDDYSKLLSIFHIQHAAIKEKIINLEKTTVELFEHPQLQPFKDEIVKQNNGIKLYAAIMMNEFLKLIHQKSNNSMKRSEENKDFVERLKYLDCNALSTATDAFASLSNFKANYADPIANCEVAAAYFENLLSDSVSKLFSKRRLGQGPT